MVDRLSRHVAILRISIVSMHCRWSWSTHLTMWLIGEVWIIILRSRALWRVLRLKMRWGKHIWVAIWDTVVWRGLMLKMRGLRVYRSIGAG